MSEVTIVNGQVNVNNLSALDVSRGRLFDGLAKTGEVLGAYASDMNGAFGFGWWDSKGEVKKAVKAEHAKFIHDGETKLKWSRSQIDTYWSRVKDAAGRTKAPRVKGETSVDSVNAKDLTTILNRIFDSAPADAPLSHKVFEALIDIADLMNIDTEKYTKVAE